VLGDVENRPVGRADEEPADTPRLRGQGVDDLVAASTSHCVGVVHVVDLDGEQRVLGRRRVPRDELDVFSGARHDEAGDPVEAHVLRIEPEVVRVEGPRFLDVGHREVGRHADDSHRLLQTSLSLLIVPRGTGGRPPDASRVPLWIDVGARRTDSLT